MHHFKKTTYYLDACCQQSANGRDRKNQKKGILAQKLFTKSN